MNNRGFTLLEVLVALGIVAIISILAWRGLEEVLRLSSRVDHVDAQLQTLSAVFSQLEEDVDALELSATAPAAQNNPVRITDTGLALDLIRRNTGEPAFLERVSWTWENGKLMRLTQRADQTHTGIPIEIAGMRLRLFQEPGGWTQSVEFGANTELAAVDFPLQGASNTLNRTGEAAGANTGHSAALIRAVEITLTQSNKQAVRRVFLTGGEY